jgi:hypothetical protein
MRPSRRLHRVLHLTTGGLSLGGALAIYLAPHPALHWQLLQPVLLGIGILLLALAALPRPAILARLSFDFCLALLGLAAATTLIEGGARLVGFDFRGLEAARRRLPPFYQKPMVSTGDVFFRRPGPFAWRGQVIRTCLETLRWSTDDYRDEPVITVRYDGFGFRNEPRPSEWEVSVAGDSFTELGYLPYEALFTTRLSQRTGWRVLNLGVSHTGPLSHLHYLETYGLSPATRHTVIVFYEGNDFEDLDREAHARASFRAQGRYEPEEFRPQSSFLGALADWLSRSDPPPPESLAADALWSGPAGEVALTFENTAPSSRSLDPGTIATFDQFLSRYAELGRARAVRVWLAYMPCKARVLHGHARLTAEGKANLAGWEPTDLPAFVARRCTEAGVAFLDLTPALVAALETDQQLPYNPRYDSHLNAHGAEVVSRALAAALDPTARP